MTGLYREGAGLPSANLDSGTRGFPEFKAPDLKAKISHDCPCYGLLKGGGFMGGVGVRVYKGLGFGWFMGVGTWGNPPFNKNSPP